MNSWFWDQQLWKYTRTQQGIDWNIVRLGDLVKRHHMKNIKLCSCGAGSLDWQGNPFAGKTVNRRFLMNFVNIDTSNLTYSKFHSHHRLTAHLREQPGTCITALLWMRNSHCLPIGLYNQVCIDRGHVKIDLAWICKLLRGRNFYKSSFLWLLRHVRGAWSLANTTKPSRAAGTLLSSLLGENGGCCPCGSDYSNSIVPLTFCSTSYSTIRLPLTKLFFPLPLLPSTVSSKENYIKITKAWTNRVSYCRKKKKNKT